MRILFVEPYERTLFSFRKELVDTLIAHGYELVLCTEKTQKVVDEYGKKVSKIIGINLDLKSKSVLANLKLKSAYKRIIKNEKPDLILSYTVKPNLYCGCCAKNIPMIANVTGLGNLFKTKGLLSSIGVHLYRQSFKNVKYVFFQNTDGLKFFKDNKIPVNNYKIIPGSGVNTEKFNFMPLNIERKEVHFLYASRAIEEKGFDLLMQAIPEVLKVNSNIHFNFMSAEEDLENNQAFHLLEKKYEQNISVLKRTDDMAKVYYQNDFLILPSFYREGISNVLLESLSCGRPIVTTNDNPGCKEVLLDGVNGFGVRSRNLPTLIDAILKASRCDKATIEKMGMAGRRSVCSSFDRKAVVECYEKVIQEIIEERK